jgi:hypothetical protein
MYFSGWSIASGKPTAARLSAEASIHSIISLVVSSKLHAVIEARPLGAKISRGF